MRNSATLIIVASATVLYVFATSRPALGWNPAPVEYSNSPDRETALGLGVQGLYDPHQVLYTEPLDDPGPPHIVDSFDYAVGAWPNRDVDALAAYEDQYLSMALLWNEVDLLVSFEGDAVLETAVYGERTHGRVDAIWSHQDLCNTGGSASGSIEDLDGLELWGPEGSENALVFSLEPDPSSASIWYFELFGGGATEYLSRSVIFDAVQSLGFTGDEADVDVDALMVHDSDLDWADLGDIVVFSIRAAANWDGGEIVVMIIGPGGLVAKNFLTHGGHQWNTAFPVAQTFGVGTEEVDAIEAAPIALLPWRQALPTVSTWGLIGLALLLAATTAGVLARRRLRSSMPR